MVNLAQVRASGAMDYLFSYPDYEAYRDSAHSFSGLIAFRQEHMRLAIAGASGAAKAEFAFVFAVSENYLQVLGVTPARGRTFHTEPAVLISENYWQRRFAGDPAVLGKTIRLNSVAVTIVGIAPRDFVGTHVAAPDFWLPLSLEPLVHGDENWLRDRENKCCRLYGRLAPGASRAQAQAEMTLRAEHLRGLHDPHSDAAKPSTILAWRASPFPLPLKAYPGLQLAIVLILAAAGMVLAVACANVASLQMARARSRQHELQTRLSLGAGRFRIVRQLLTESALLGLLSGVVALLFTWVLLKVSVTLAIRALPDQTGTLIFDVNPNLEIFLSIFAVSATAGVLFGLAPAMDSSRSALSGVVRGSTSLVRSRRLQDLLIAAQVALSLMLMIAGSMFVRGAIRELKMSTGYDSKHVVDVDFQFPEGPKYNADRKLALVGALRARVAALPGVDAITSARPPSSNLFYPTAAAAQNWQFIAVYTFVQANYFDTLGIPLLLGRGFPLDGGQTGHSVIVSESAAQQLWPGQNPIGRSLRLGATDERFHNRSELVADGPVYEVIGVARDTRGVEFDGSDSRVVYLPLAQQQLANRPILIHTQSDPGTVIRAMDTVIASIDPDLLATSSTLDGMLRQTGPFIASSLAAAVASATGLFGLLLALMGIYGTVSYIVALRTREIGIRIAIGAQNRDVLGLILRESTRPVLIGLMLGMVLAVGATYVLHGLFYGLSGIDGISCVGVSFMFLAIALLAAYPPSRRALRVDPMVALRYE
jgi:predicted permease